MDPWKEIAMQCSAVEQTTGPPSTLSKFSSSVGGMTLPT